MKISEVEREQHLSDMKSLIVDNRKQKKRFPRDPEFAELCGISIGSVKVYRKIIAQRNKKSLVERFAIEKVQSIEDTVDTLYEHIDWYKGIKKDTENDIETRMSAAKLIEEAQKNITEVMADYTVMLDDVEIPDNLKDKDNVLFNKKHLHGTEEKITEGIKSITD